MRRGGKKAGGKREEWLSRVGEEAAGSSEVGAHASGAVCQLVSGLCWITYWHNFAHSTSPSWFWLKQYVKADYLGLTVVYKFSVALARVQQSSTTQHYIALRYF